MGLGWLIVAIFLPGVPQLLHLDLLKVIIIWAGPALAGAAASGIGISLSSITSLGPLSLGVGILIGLYNLYTAFEY